MADELLCIHDQAPLISAKDRDLGQTISATFLKRYEVHSYRNAARILASASPIEFGELKDTLMEFTILTQEMVEKGRNKSKIALKMDDLLMPKGWYETRIRGDMIIETTTTEPNPKKNRSASKTIRQCRIFRINSIIDGHKIDFVKNRVAFDMEWNSKDQTFDRDLYAMRTFYEAGIIDAGILLTRDATLGGMFAEIGSRVPIKDFKSKYGASTTWMRKLTYRLDAGRGGGCPILAIGITPAVVGDYEEWKAANPVIRERIEAVELIAGDANEEEAEE
jgi:hypothetical protein